MNKQLTKKMTLIAASLLLFLAQKHRAVWMEVLVIVALKHMD